MGNLIWLPGICLLFLLCYPSSGFGTRMTSVNARGVTSAASSEMKYLLDTVRYLLAEVSV